jgi:hypothetical protein
MVEKEEREENTLGSRELTNARVTYLWRRSSVVFDVNSGRQLNKSGTTYRLDEGEGDMIRSWTDYEEWDNLPTGA